MAVIRLDKVAGLHLESIKAPEALKNGYFVQLGALELGEKELRGCTKVADVTKEVLLHATPEVMADPRQAGLKHFEVVAGEVGRAYHLTVGDVITLTGDLFASTPIVGDAVSPQAGSFLLDDADATARLKFEVIQKTTLGYDNEQAFMLQVVSA